MIPLTSGSWRPRDLAKENALSRPFRERRRRLESLGRSIWDTLLLLAVFTALGAAVVFVGGRPVRPHAIAGGSSRSGLKACRGESALCRGIRGEARRGASIS